MRLTGKDSTNFFHKDIMLYSFFDLSFPRPVSLKLVGYYVLFFLLFSVPLFFLVGFSPPFLISLGLYLGVPGGLAWACSTPFIQGHNLVSFIGVSLSYLFSPANYCDGVGVNSFDETYQIDGDVWISRREDYSLLAEIDREVNGVEL